MRFSKRGSVWGLAAVFALCLGTADVWAQCEGGNEGGGGPAPTAGQTASARGFGGISLGGGTASFGGANTASVSGLGRNATRGFGGGGIAGVPQMQPVDGTYAMSMIQAVQAQQMANYRSLAESGVRNRRSEARQQQLLTVNAERAYRSGLSAEKSGRYYSALKQYERAANIAPGSLASKYAEEAISRLQAKRR